MIQQKNTCSGFTLIEVLVAMLVLSIGLLGLAGLQLTSLRTTNSAYWSSQAVWLSYDIVDRMRANPSGVQLGSYNSLDTSSISNPGCISSAGGCSSADLAATDEFEWAQAIGQLPGGRATTSVAGNIFTIRVMWDDAGTGVTGIGCDPTTGTDLFCYETQVDI